MTATMPIHFRSDKKRVGFIAAALAVLDELAYDDVILPG
jgi:hypothetical protein